MRAFILLLLKRINPLMRILLFSLLAFVLSFPAFAHSFQTGDIKIGHPWALPTAPGAENGEAYLALMNVGKNAEQLQGATTSIAKKITLQQDGQTVNGIDLAPGRGVSLIPGKNFLKLEGLKGGLSAGDKFTVKLKFASAPPVDVTVFVEDQADH